VYPIKLELHVKLKVQQLFSIGLKYKQMSRVTARLFYPSEHSHPYLSNRWVSRSQTRRARGRKRSICLCKDSKHDLPSSSL